MARTAAALAPQPPDFYTASFGAHPQNAMPLNDIRKGLGLASRDRINAMRDEMALLASEDDTLQDPHIKPQESAYKVARDDIIADVQTGPVFGHLWTVNDKCPNITPDWVRAAGKGLWTSLKLSHREAPTRDTKLEALGDAHTTDSDGDAPPHTRRLLRRASNVSTKSNETVGADALSRLTIKGPTKMQPAYAPDRFGDIRVNCYVLGESDKIFSFRMSSIVGEQDQGILSGREEGILNELSVDFTLFNATVAANIEATRPSAYLTKVFYPDDDGPRQITSRGGLRLPVGKIARGSGRTWDLALAHGDVDRDDGELTRFCELLRTQVYTAEQPARVNRPRVTTDNSRGHGSSSSIPRGKPGNPPPEQPATPKPLAPLENPASLEKPAPPENPAAPGTPTLNDPLVQEQYDGLVQHDVLNADFAWDTDLGSGGAADEEENARIQRSNDALNDRVSGAAARMTHQSFDEAADRFYLDATELKTSTKEVYFPKTWLLAEGAFLRPHQWQSLSEQIKQNNVTGGGYDGSGMGVGKTHPNGAQGLVFHWIQIMRTRVETYRQDVQSKDALGESPDQPLHLRGDEALINGRPQTCPSQHTLPMQCPCHSQSWTNANMYNMPSGCTLITVLPNTGGEWCKAILDLFFDAPILELPTMPARIAIEHVETAKIITNMYYQRKLKKHNSDVAAGRMPADAVAPVKKKTTHPFGPASRAEWAMACIEPDEAQLGDIYAYAAKVFPSCDEDGEPLEGGDTSRWYWKGIDPEDIPRGATTTSSSPLAHSLIILSTPKSLEARLAITTVFAEIRNETMTINGKLIDVALIIWDEAHNVKNHTAVQFRVIETLQADKEARQDYKGCYWMLTGTPRESGPDIIATHFAHLLADKEWTEDCRTSTRRPFIREKREKVFKHLAYERRKDGMTDKVPRSKKEKRAAEKRPYEVLIDSYKSLYKGTTAAAKKYGAKYDMTKDPVFIEYTTVMGDIVIILGIERNEDTIGLTSKPLLQIAEIVKDEQNVPIVYNTAAVEFIAKKADKVMAEAQKDLQIRTERALEAGLEAPVNMKDFKFISSY
ncbi:hypothetical protein HBI81_243240 [Parastagonospora nodorum]|nr:hypothetical protein HBI81_243240 [Parastagonospora nodorum]